VLSDVHLRVVLLDSILPHEIADPGREARIERRIADEAMLRDPLLVGSVADVAGLVLLDGTNRRAALEHLGLPLAMVQIIDYANPDAIQLRTWCHAAPVRADDLAARAGGLPGVTATSLSPLASQDALSAPDTLAAILDPHRRFVMRLETDTGRERVASLRAFVDLYEQRMTRVDCEVDAVEERARSLSGGQCLIAFPPVTRGQVVAMALDGTRIPAGITRHVILGGRALRVNLPLEVLALPDEAHANEALARHLAVLHPRVYGEPTVLFDS
jgi:hypothetical protein